jgi:ParB family chromosome partitioning protein
MKMSEIDLEKLFLGKCNVRRDLGDISELVESIRQVGVLEPLIVRSVEGRYEVIVGNRRYNAAKRAGLRTVPCIIKEMDDDAALIASLTENIQRGDISEEEIARAYTVLHEANPKRWIQEAFAKRIGKSQSWLSHILVAYESLIKLEALGVAKGMKAYPKKEERETGIVPVEHLKEIEYAMRSEEVRKLLSEKEIEEKRVELAKEVLELPIDDAKRVIDRLKMYPEKPVKEIKEEAMARKTGVALETYLPPKIARELDKIAEERKASIEEVLPGVIEEALKARLEMKERVEVPTRMVKEIEVGEVECPECGTILRLIHCEPGKAHKVERKTS